MSSSVAKIPCTLEKFFKYWLLFTSPLHKLQKKDIEILSYILYKRFELSKVISDDSLLDYYLFSKDIRSQIIDDLGEKRANFLNTLTRLRKRNVLLSNNTINKKFIPNLDKDIKKFDLMILFEITDDIKQRDSEISE